MENEIWKTYPEINWIQGSNLGNVRTLDRYVMRKNGRRYFVKGHVLPQQRIPNGYMRVGFGVNGKHTDLLVHRVIAMCFLPNPNNYPQVNHIDCNPTNNRVENLEWCTPQYNSAYRDKLGHLNVKDNAPKSPVIAVSLKTLEALCFPSQHEAARQLGASDGHINDVLKGRYKQTGGYWFTNADENSVESTRAKFGNSVARKVEELLNKEE